MPKISYVDGKYIAHKKASISIEDRGFLFADGIYEVCTVFKDDYYDLAAHFDRLKYSAEQIELNIPWRFETLKIISSELLRRNNLNSSALYIQVTRGQSKRAHEFPLDIRPTLVMMLLSRSKITIEQRLKGASAILLPDERWARPDIKSISLLPNIIAKNKAHLAGAKEAILYRENRLITEGSASNFFIVSNDNILKTHPISKAILNGITRREILDHASRNNIQIVEEPIHIDELATAKEAFISSATMKIMPIVKIGEQMIGNGQAGEVTKFLINRI